MQRADLARIHHDIREAALSYAQRGFKVVRIWGIVTNGKGELVCACSLGARCSKAGKHPNLGNAWQHQATSNRATIAKWWDEKPESNVGLLGVNPLGVVVDLDRLKKGEKGRSGLDVWEELQAIHGPAPETMTVRSGSGGLHLFFREPPGQRSGNKLAGFEGLKKIDIRGKGGQVVAPPSLHKSGNQYELIVDKEPALAPEWFYEPVPTPLLRTKAKKAPSHKLDTGAGVEKRISANPVKSLTASKFQDEKMQAKVVELFGRRDPDAVLTEATSNLLKYGRSGYDQSALIQKIILGALAVNFCVGKLFLMLEDPNNAGGEGVQTRIKARGRDSVIDDWMRRSIWSAQRFRAEQILAVAEIRESVERYEWTRTEYWQNGEIATATKKVTTSAKSMKAVLYAALDIAEKDTNTAPMLSKGMVAKEAGVSVPTVRSVLHGLEELGWIETNTEGRGVKVYQFLDPSKRVNPLLSSVEPRPKGMTQRDYDKSRQHRATTASVTYRKPGPAGQADHVALSASSSSDISRGRCEIEPRGHRSGWELPLHQDRAR